MIPANKSTDSLQLVATPEPDPRQEFLGKEFRLLDRYELQTDLVETLKQTGNHKHLVPKVARCHRSFRHWRCENNHDWAEAENSCSVRVCPHCSQRRTLILAGRMEKFVSGKVGLRYAVLAERNSTDLVEGVKSLWASWTSLRRSVAWKRKVKGCVVALEVTYNRDEQTWHPHLNVLMEGEYFPFEELRQAWSETTNHRGQTSFIRAADEGTVRELIKYVTKVSDLLDDAGALDQFLTAIERRRLIRTYGTFYALKMSDEENPQTGCCPDCDSSVAVRLGYVHSHQISLDFKGVLRPSRSPQTIRSELETATEFPAVIPAAPALRPLSSLLRHWDGLHKKFAATSRMRSNTNGDSTNYSNPAARDAGNQSAGNVPVHQAGAGDQRCIDFA